jgi:hypothetical protein
MKTFLNKPFKRVESSRERLVSIPVFGLFIFLFLFLFKPFGMANLQEINLFYLCAGFGLVTTFVLFILRFLIEPQLSRKNWTMGKNILWDLFIASSVGVANFFYVGMLLHQILTVKYLLMAIWTAILVGIIPVTISYIVRFNRIYRNALSDSAIKPEEILWDEEITITAGNPKNEFKLNPKHILYLCSNDNYVTVATLKGGLSAKTTIRGTLKAAESELSRNNRFIRCHKCYIVNMDYVSGLRGNNQNMTIKLSSSDTEIPVSRSRAGHVTRLIKKGQS